MKEIIDDGSIGELRSIILYNNGNLFNAASHSLDLALRLSGDVPAKSVQGNLAEDDSIFEGDLLREDPEGRGHRQAGERRYNLRPIEQSEW